jgi:hypothetical protein
MATSDRLSLPRRLSKCVAGAALLFTFSSLGACKRTGPALDEGQGVLSSAGLKIEDFHPTPPSPFSAKECREGKIEGLSAVLCVYASAEARARGEKVMEDWVSTAVTGTWVRRDIDPTHLFLLGLADRNRADLNGKTMVRVTSAFEKK